MNILYNGTIGLVVGDALGVPVEFEVRDTYKIEDMSIHSTYDYPAGTWSDDSSMTLATLESIARLGTINAADIMNNFYEWLQNAKFTPWGEVFDVGKTTREAIARYVHGTEPLNCGGKGFTDNGNGALMRILPITMLTHDQKTILDIAHLTHAHSISDFACLIYGKIVRNLMSGMDKKQAVLNGIQEFLHALPKEYRRFPFLTNLQRDEIKSSGYVVDTLEAALWCFLTTNNYRECVLTAVNLGEDTDTVAAVGGGLAGIYYGCVGDSGIPKEWITQIPHHEWIEDVCSQITL